MCPQWEGCLWSGAQRRRVLEPRAAQCPHRTAGFCPLYVGRLGPASLGQEFPHNTKRLLRFLSPLFPISPPGKPRLLLACAVVWSKARGSGPSAVNPWERGLAPHCPENCWRSRVVREDWGAGMGGRPPRGPTRGLLESVGRGRSSWHPEALPGNFPRVSSRERGQDRPGWGGGVPPGERGPRLGKEVSSVHAQLWSLPPDQPACGPTGPGGWGGRDSEIFSSQSGDNVAPLSPPHPGAPPPSLRPSSVSQCWHSLPYPL